MLRLEYFIFLDDEELKLLSFSFHGINDALETILHFWDVIGVYFGDSLLQTVELEFVLSFNFVDLLFENGDLLVRLLLLFLSLLAGLS